MKREAVALLTVNIICCCAATPAFLPAWSPSFHTTLPRHAASGTGLKLVTMRAFEANHNQDPHTRKGPGNDNEKLAKSRRAVLRGIVGAAVALTGLESLQQAHAEVGSVAWPIAAGASGRIPDNKNVQSTTSVPEPAPGQTLMPDSEVAPMPGLKQGEEGVREGVRKLVEGDPKIAAGLLRLAFHDATARDTDRGRGANGSILFELDRRENYGLGVAIKELQKVKVACGMSWADTIAVAGSAAVEAVGGPRIRVALGRKDASVPDPLRLRKPVADMTIPSAGLDSDGIRNYFGRLGFDDGEVVALMGGHTIGRWTSLLGMKKECLKDLNSKWARCLPQGERLPFVSEDPDRFSNSYFKWLLLWNKREIQPGDVHFIPSDVVLVVDEGFQSHVRRFASDEKLFFETFSRAYTRLVGLGFTA